MWDKTLGNEDKKVVQMTDLEFLKMIPIWLAIGEYGGGEKEAKLIIVIEEFSVDPFLLQKIVQYCC